MHGFTDTSIQSDKDDNKLQFGFLSTINGNTISWKSFKQDTIVDSIIDAEYIAALEAVMKQFGSRNSSAN